MSSQAIPIPGPLGIGDIIDRAFRIYRARFKPMVLTALAVLLPLGLLTGALNFVLTSQVMSDDSIDLGVTLASGLGSILILIVSWLGQGLAELALTFHALAALRDEQLEPGDSISRAGTRLGSWLGMSLLRGLVVAGTFSVILIPTMFLAIATDENPSFIVALCMLPLIMILAVIAFLYVQTRWIVATPSLVVEETGATGSLRRSWSLTRRKFWRSFAVMAVLGVISMVVLSLPTFVIQMFAFGISSDLPLPSAIGTFFSAVISALYVPVTASAFLVLYYDLRVRQENLDLDQRVGQLESELRVDEGPLS